MLGIIIITKSEFLKSAKISVRGKEKRGRHWGFPCWRFIDFRHGGFYLILSEQLENLLGVAASYANEAIYLCTWVAKVPNEFIDDVGISDGTNTYSGLHLSSGDYGGWIRDIRILPGRWKQMRD